MSSETPSVTVKIADVEYAVNFNVGKLIEIEESLKETVFVIASRQPGIANMSDFIGACIGTSRKQVIASVKPGEMFDLYTSLLQPFGKAARQFLPVTAQNPQTAQSEAPLPS